MEREIVIDWQKENPEWPTQFIKPQTDYDVAGAEDYHYEDAGGNDGIPF